ncbi:MAG TPA: acyltransferase, partial [Bacteroidia bacterium]|nr:acyltransferase [Bacteroidia bacterium]
YYGLFFVFVILDQNFSPESFLKLGRYKILSFWGKYTYGIYLLHPVAIATVSWFVIHYNIIEANFLNYLIIGLISLILTLAISYLSYEFYEKKFLAFKKKFSVIVRD